MLCLHGKPTGTIKTEKGTLLVCQQPSTCHFSCSEGRGYLYGRAVECFLRTNQDRPLCCMGEDGTRNYAKMETGTGSNLGRPMFVCSKKSDPCNYFAWGDKRIVPRPVCEHGKPAQLLGVKNKGPYKGRKFYACYQDGQNKCHFFEWVKEDLDDAIRRVLYKHSIFGN